MTTLKIASTIGSGRNELTINTSKVAGLSSVTGTIYDCEGVVVKMKEIQPNGLSKVVSQDISAEFLGTTMTVMIPTEQVGLIQKAAAKQKALTGNVIGLVFTVGKLNKPQLSLNPKGEGEVSYSNVCNSFQAYVGAEEPEMIEDINSISESFSEAVEDTQVKAKNAKLNWFERKLQNLGIKGQAVNPAEVAASLKR